MPVQTPPPPPTSDHQYRPSSTKTGSLTTTTTTHPPPPESEHLPCPRCDSTNTKFCYYNNYNFSQPRHFCKSCRRYWTHGGTLRDIPVGGGTRKNAKRPRNSSSSTSNANTTTPTGPTPTPTPTPTSSSSSSAGCVGGNSRSGHPHSTTTLSSSTTSAVTSTVSSGLSLTTGSLIDPVFVSMSSSLPASGVYVEDYLKPSSSQGQSGVFPVGSMGLSGSFTSLLNASGGGGFLALGGFGVGPSFEDAGFGRGMWATVPEVSYLDNGTAANTTSGYGVAGNGNFWQMESGGEHHHHHNHTDGGSAGVGFVSGDCFSWPELAISTPRNGLK